MRFTLISMIALLSSVTQVNSQEICTGILSYASRDVISESRENSIASSLYTEHCEGSSSKNGSSSSIGLEAVVKAIPVKFSYGGSSNSEKLNNFCKVYDSRRAEFSSQAIDKSIVVREALESFNNCISLAAKEIYFNPSIGRTRLVVDVRRGSSDAAINGVSYDPQLLTCLIPPLNAGRSKTSKIADKDTVVDLNGNYMPLTCERIPQVSNNGIAEYPRAELIVATTRGSLSLKIAADAQLSEQWASEIAGRMNSIEAKNAELSKRSFQCEMKQEVATGQYPRIVASIPMEARITRKLSGGGCTINSYPETPHNGTVIESRPTDDQTGWSCFAGDPPNIPLTLRLTAYAIYCGVD